ncbi:MAG: uracil phosphoribosyltransferase, partial [Bacteroidales bacterium]|nr:uracil phosphoribosyltransferase [Candidatus Egerieousia equi]
MKTIDYSNQNSILGQYLSQMRDKQIQKDPRRFRMNLERIGAFFAAEISKTLNYKTIEVTTPLGIAECNV